ncbi:MAG: phosphotransferase [Ardenticatenaceae bacterium]|nr:phosphotransferase [Anaerolineales bacterium]MCB8942035.1 phosphotransferase [Ardenticatenaceae bacterium]MCB8973205.1 phosphotransferase [Ardenticatenaceae bacterium]
MTSPKQPYPTIEQVHAWLAEHHGAEIKNLAPLSGGFWSSAYAYQIGADALVFRLSTMAEGFAIDRAAMRFNGPNLPVPTVRAVGQALGFHYAISERHYGRFIETTAASERDAVGTALATLLAALRAAPTAPEDGVVWYDQSEAANISWHTWLTNGLKDNSANHVSGWRAKLAEQPEIDNLFQRCEARIHELLPACPERRDLVHGDLLHQNVLVAEDVGEVTAVFSWKCSALGDFLYDVAWCTFWSDWHPGIAAANIWQRTLAAPDLTPADLENAALRHHCYELQIGASHLGWNAWTNNQKELEAVASKLKLTMLSVERQGRRSASY